MKKMLFWGLLFSSIQLCGSIHDFVLERNLDQVKKLVVENKENVHVVNEHGYTPLHIAAFDSQIEIVEFLLDQGADVNALSHDQESPLALAMSRWGQDPQVLRLLIDHGADTSVTIEGLSLIHFVVRGGERNIDLLKFLIESGVDVNTKGRDDATPLHIAAERDRATVQLLLDYKADMNALVKDVYTPIYMAAKEGKKEIVQLLIERGADVKIQDLDGGTLLHLSALLPENQENIQLLIDQGVDVNAKAIEGITALLLAVRSNSYENVKVLLNAGADPNSLSKDGWSPLLLARYMNNEKIIQLLEERLDSTATEKQA